MNFQKRELFSGSPGRLLTATLYMLKWVLRDYMGMLQCPCSCVFHANSSVFHANTSANTNDDIKKHKCSGYDKNE